MVNRLIIEEYIRQIEETESHENQFIMMARGLIDLFQLSNVYFFRYSPIGYLGEGILFMDNNRRTESITNVKDDLRSLPVILSAIKNRKAFYTSQESYFTHSSNFPYKPIAPSILIVPICLSANVVGYTITTKIKDQNRINDDFLSLLTFYGKRFGKLLEKEYNYYPITSLSKREIEAMQLLAYGYSVKEIAIAMNISEHTVKDYIKSAIKKTETRNRLHAVVVLLRKGIIT